MICRKYRDELIEYARGVEPRPELVEHIAHCAACASFYAEQQALSAVLRDLAGEPIPSAHAIRARVMEEFDGASRLRFPVAGWLAAAVVAAAASFYAFVPPPQPAPPPVAEEGQFVPIPYTVPLTPEERATVVRMEIPVSALVAAGFEMPAADPGAVMQADVLVSQDGRARAIRPISISSSN